MFAPIPALLAARVQSTLQRCGGDAGIRRRGRRTALLAVVPALVACVSGCAGDDVVLEAADVERGVAQSVSVDLDLPVSDVVCPPFAILLDGATVVCTASVAGSPTSFDVTLVDAEAARLSVANREAVIDVAELDADIEQGLGEQLGRDVTADCGSDVVRPTPVGGSFECTVTSIDGDAGLVIVEVVDDSLAVSWRLVD